MSVPAAMMPGSAPPGGAPGAGPGGPGAGGDDVLKALLSMQQTPPQNGEEELFRNASSAVGLLYQRVAPRSAKAAGKIANCLKDLQAARESLQSEATRPMAGPPDLGLSGFGAPSPGMPMPGF